MGLARCRIEGDALKAREGTGNGPPDGVGYANMGREQLSKEKTKKKKGDQLERTAPANAFDDGGSVLLI